MPGSVINNTSAVAVIIQAVSAPLMLDCATRPGRISGATAGTEAVEDGASAGAMTAGSDALAAGGTLAAAGTVPSDTTIEAGAAGTTDWAHTVVPKTNAQAQAATFKVAS